MSIKLNQYTGLPDLVNPEPDLSPYVPYTGATSDIDLNDMEITNVDKIGINVVTPTKYLEVVGLDDQPSRGAELLTNYNFVGSETPWVLTASATWNAGGGIPYILGSGGIEQSFTHSQYALYEVIVVYQGAAPTVVQIGSIPSASFENGEVLSTTFDGTYYTRKYYTQCHWSTASSYLYLLLGSGTKIFSVSLKRIIDASITASISKDGVGAMDIRGGDQYGNIALGKLSGSGMSSLTSKCIAIGDYTLSQGLEATDTIAIGDGVFRYLPDPIGSTVVGSNAYASVVIGAGNGVTAFGAGVFKNTIGSTYDSGFGYRAGHNLVSNSGYNTIGGANSAGGQTTPSASFGTVTIWGANCAPQLQGSDNSFFGALVGTSITTGSGNVSIGSSSLNSTEATASNNICIGVDAGGSYSALIQDNNILIGDSAQIPYFYIWTPAENSNFWNIGNAFFASGVTGGTGGGGNPNDGKFSIGLPYQYFDLPYRFSLCEPSSLIFDQPWYGLIAFDFVQGPYDEFDGQSPMDKVALFQLEYDTSVTKLNLFSQKYDQVAADGSKIACNGELNIFPDGGTVFIDVCTPKTLTAVAWENELIFLDNDMVFI